jgi:hypothetical protein
VQAADLEAHVAAQAFRASVSNELLLILAAVVTVYGNLVEATQGKAEDSVTYLKKEGGVQWKAEEFTRLRIESKLKNAQDHLISYELVPLRPGSPRHFGPDEEFTSNDFWVTPYKFEELYYPSLPIYVKKNRSIEDTDVVIWYMSPAYHLPRDEDGIFIRLAQAVIGPRAQRRPAG